MATEDISKDWILREAGDPAHLVHTSWPDISSMHPSPRHSLVELKHLDRTHWELVTKSWAPKSDTMVVYSPAPSLLVPNQPLMTQSSSRI